MASPARPASRSLLLGGLLGAVLLLAAAPARAEVVHVVAHGQTLGRIAKRYHVTVDAIREVNGLRPASRFHPGLSLVIPEKGKEAEAAKKAAVSRGKKVERQGRDRLGVNRAGPAPPAERQARGLGRAPRAPWLRPARPRLRGDRGAARRASRAPRAAARWPV